MAGKNKILPAIFLFIAFLVLFPINVPNSQTNPTKFKIVSYKYIFPCLRIKPCFI